MRADGNPIDDHSSHQDRHGVSANSNLFVDRMPHNYAQSDLEQLVEEQGGGRQGMVNIWFGTKVLRPSEFRTATIRFHTTHDAVQCRLALQHYRHPNWVEPLVINFVRKRGDVREAGGLPGYAGKRTREPEPNLFHWQDAPPPEPAPRQAQPSVKPRPTFFFRFLGPVPTLPQLSPQPQPRPSPDPAPALALTLSHRRRNFGQPGAARRSSHAFLLLQVQQCRHFARGHCERGANCMFAHGGIPTSGYDYSGSGGPSVPSQPNYDPYAPSHQPAPVPGSVSDQQAQQQWQQQQVPQSYQQQQQWQGGFQAAAPQDQQQNGQQVAHDPHAAAWEAYYAENPQARPPQGQGQGQQQQQQEPQQEQQGDAPAQPPPEQQQTAEGQQQQQQPAPAPALVPPPAQQPAPPPAQQQPVPPAQQQPAPPAAPAPPGTAVAAFVAALEADLAAERERCATLEAELAAERERNSNLEEQLAAEKE